MPSADFSPEAGFEMTSERHLDFGNVFKLLSFLTGEGEICRRRFLSRNLPKANCELHQPSFFSSQY
jgi:hypothetical protein